MLRQTLVAVAAAALLSTPAEASSSRSIADQTRVFKSSTECRAYVRHQRRLAVQQGKDILDHDRDTLVTMETGDGRYSGEIVSRRLECDKAHLSVQVVGHLPSTAPPEPPPPPPPPPAKLD